MAQTLYTAVATATSGRDGKATSSDGNLDLDIKPPKELGGPGGGTNPEQLFAAGYAACFQSAMNLVAKGEKLDTEGGTVTAHVDLAKGDDGGYGIGVEMHVNLPKLDKAQAESLVAKAHEVCPYSKATRGNVDVKLVVD